MTILNDMFKEFKEVLQLKKGPRKEIKFVETKGLVIVSHTPVPPPAHSSSHAHLEVVDSPKKLIRMKPPHPRPQRELIHA